MRIGVPFAIFDKCLSTPTILAWTRSSTFRRISPFYSPDLSPAGGMHTYLEMYNCSEIINEIIINNNPYTIFIILTAATTNEHGCSS